MVRDSLSKLLGVTPHPTGHRWFVMGKLPKGEKLVTLQYMLEVCGYVPSERTSLDHIQREIADMVALSVLPVKEITGLLEISDITLYRWCFGKTLPSEVISNAIREIILTYAEEIRTKKEALLAGLQDLRLVSDVTVEKIAPAKESVVVITPEGTPGNDDEVQILAHLILASIPLATKLLSNSAGGASRDMLRELTKTQNGRSNGVFELSNLLSRLCGERARTQLQ